MAYQNDHVRTLLNYVNIRRSFLNKAIEIFTRGPLGASIAPQGQEDASAWSVHCYTYEAAPLPGTWDFKSLSRFGHW